MVNFSRQLVLLIVGLALLLPLSVSAFAEPVTRYPSGQFNFYSDWMSPRVEPMESKTLYVSEYAKRDLQPREEQVQVTAPAPVTRSKTGQFNFYSDWMSPRVEPMESKVLFVSEYAKRDLQPREVQTQAKVSASPYRDYSAGPYNFYSDWMSPRVKPMETKTFPFRTQGTTDKKNQVVVAK